MNGAIVIEGHVQGLSNTRSLGELGIPVYVVDTVHCLAQHSKYCKKYFKCPPFNTSEFIDFLLSLGKKERLEGWLLIGSNDHIVENLSLNQDRLQPYYKMLVPNKSKLYDIINKKTLLMVAKNCGTSIPDTCYPENLNEAKMFRYPLLVKGNLGLSFYKATHKKAIQVDDYTSLQRVINQLHNTINFNDVMIQELIPSSSNNRVVSFTCFAENGNIKTFWMGQKLREHPVRYGTATFAQSVYIDDILNEAAPLVKALDYTGVCEVEFMLDNRDGKYKLIEINPRTWLWVGLAKACGVDYAKMVYRFVNNIPQSYPTNYLVGVKWINRLTDAFYAVKLLFDDKTVPGMIFPFLSLYIAFKRG